MRRAKRYGFRFILPVIAAIFIFACFADTAKVGYPMPYSDDDVMNLYSAWNTTPMELLHENLTFAAGRRPLGAAFYRAQFARCGFRSQPLHVAVWIFLAINLWLAWLLFRQLGADAESALLGLTIFAMHGALRDLSFYTGTLYDTFCFTFYVTALLVHLRARAKGAPGWRSLLLFALLFACALNCKEMALSLPVVVLLWELVFHPPESRKLGALGKRFTAEWRGVVLSTVIAAIFITKALSSQSAVHGMAAYTPVVTFQRWIETSAQYLSFTFYGSRPAGPWAIALYAGVIGLAIVSVTRRVKSFAAFAALWFLVTLLPVSFVPPRVSGYVLYIPLLLWALYAGMLLAKARRRLVASRGLLAGVSQAALLLTLAVGFGVLNRLKPKDPPQVESSTEERTARQFKQLYPALAAPVRLLFLHDAFQPDTNALIFTLRLLYRNKEIYVDRLSAPADQHPPLANLPHYDHIFLRKECPVEPR